MSDDARYAVYLRKSRADLDAEAMGQGETLARHRAALQEYADRNGLSIGGIYEEIVSGDSIEARPEMLRLLSDVEKGRWAGVLCMDIDRLARGDSADQARISRTFRISGTLIITPSRIYDTTRDSDEEYVDFELFMARREYKAISRRIMRGRIASAREGHFIGSTPPFGYSKVRVKKGRGYTLEPNDESGTVKLIYSLCIGGMGSSAIARRLNELGTPPRSGGEWSSASVADILRNPVYCGKIRWRYRREEKTSENGVVTMHRRKDPGCILVQGLHPAIITDSDFKAAQRAMSGRRAPPKKPGSGLRNPLSGLVFCGVCGSLMTRLGGAEGRSDILRCSGRGCSNVSSKLEQVEKALVGGLSGWLGEIRVTVGEVSAAASGELSAAAADKLRSELSRLSAQRERIYSFLEQGVYSPEEFKERMETLRQRQQRISSQLRQEEKYAADTGDIVDRKPQQMLLWEIYSAALPEEKNRILRTLISRAVYVKSARNTRSDPDRYRFTLDIIPLLPGERTVSE